MVDYLSKGGVTCDEAMRKTTLYQLVERIKSLQEHTVLTVSLIFVWWAYSGNKYRHQ